eukprot:778183_1
MSALKRKFATTKLFHLLYLLYTCTVRSQNVNMCDYNNQWYTMVNFNEPADRVYYIGCVEEPWDYAPSGKNLLTGATVTETEPSSIWLYGNQQDRVGSIYIKGLYREFTDSCFTTQKQRTTREQHLGALGPTIRAIQDETIKIFYKNTCSFPNSIHVHGLKYDKTSEGAPYNDGTSNGDNIAENGGQWIYIFRARTVISDDSSSKMWLYHSHVDEVKDINTGLFGAVVITKKGFETSNTDLIPNDIDR